MNIALVLDGLQVGGIERVCLDYCKILLDLGYHVTLFNLVPDLNELENEIPEGVKLVHLPFPRWLAPERYTGLVRRNFVCKFMYIFLYMFFTLITFLYKLFCRIRYKECRHEYNYLVAFSSHINDLTFVAQRFARANHTVSWCHGAIYSYLLMSDGFINLYNKIKNIVVLVDDSQEEVLSYNKFLNLNVYKLYNPSYVKDRKVSCKKVKKLKKEYGNFILMVSRFQYPHKDQLTVIKAFNLLLNEHKNLDTSLVFIGDGPDRKKAEIVAKKLNERIRKRIFFLGTQLDVQNYYMAAYLLVHASVAGEGLPTVMIEAMNYRLPEVVTDSKTGPREILGDNKYGLLCKIEDPKDMSEKIYRLFSDKVLYKNFQLLESQRIKDFSVKKIKNRLDYILKDIAGEINK